MAKRGGATKIIEIEVDEEEEEKESEDYCFVCKDGGLLVVCADKDCVKSYHSDCIGKGESVEDVEDDWVCDWHSCFSCGKSPKYQCICCPNAVCQPCLKEFKFAVARGNKGFCNDCLKLAILGDEGAEVDSDGEKVDFKDRDTYECLFKEYWDIINEKEGFTLEDLHIADQQIQKGEKYKPRVRKVVKSQPQPESPSKSDEYNKEDENKAASDDDDHADDPQPPSVVKSNKKRPRKLVQKNKESKRIKYVGWASESLSEFLISVGVDAKEKQSQGDVACLINKYARDNKLFHPEKKKIILCDVRLRSLLGRRSISTYKINDALEYHFAENLDQSEDEGYSSGGDEVNASLSTKKDPWWRTAGSFQNKGSLMEKFQQKDVTVEESAKKDDAVKVVYSHFATIVARNMKLVYLRRSLLELLLEQCENFESKVIGSFVKVKSNPFDPRHPHHLVPVTGIKKYTGEDDKRKVLFQVSSLPNDVPISLLSSDDLSEEDCEDLRQRIENGLVEKPTVVELEEKAKSLHEDITKHWITRELSILRHRIDLANEKGRKAELWECRRKRELLQSEEEQKRLLREEPKVIAEVIEINSTSEEPQSVDINNPVEKSK